MKRKLLECCASITDGDHLPPPKSKDGVPFVTISNFTPFNTVSFEDTMFVPQNYYDNLPDSKKPRHGDILYSVVGSFGIPVYIESDLPFVFQRHIAIFRPNQNICGKYLYYLLLNPQFQKLMDKLAIGCAQRTITLDTLRNLTIDFPDICTQEKVAGVLSAIDEKIRMNIQICTELESMAKTLYDYWFVQFDFPDENGKPYRTSGGEMVWNDQLKREIPKGWDVGNLYDIAEFINGLACQKYRPNEGDDSLPVIKITEMHDGITDNTERVSVNIPAKNKIADGDILFSWSATLEVMYWFGGNGGLNQHIFKVEPKQRFSKEYVYHQLSAYVINFVKMAETRKTTMGHITSDHLEQSRIVLAPKKYIDDFTQAIRPVHEKIGNAQQENRELTKLRDWLLPMLMNGQATVE